MYGPYMAVTKSSPNEFLLNLRQIVSANKPTVLKQSAIVFLVMPLVFF